MKPPSLSLFVDDAGKEGSEPPQCCVRWAVLCCLSDKIEAIVLLYYAYVLSEVYCTVEYHSDTS